MGIFILFAIALIIFGIIIRKNIYNSSDHHTWDKGSSPNHNAIITNVKREIVGSKGSSKYRTIITFSDGFTFISHDTNVENHLIYNKLSVDQELNNQIIEKAISAHNKAVNCITTKVGEEKTNDFNNSENKKEYKQRAVNEHNHKCPNCGYVQSKNIKRCLKCSNIISTKSTSDVD